MRVVQINSFGNLSTGSVMRSEDGRYRDEGCETWICLFYNSDAADDSRGGSVGGWRVSA